MSDWRDIQEAYKRQSPEHVKERKILQWSQLVITFKTQIIDISQYYQSGVANRWMQSFKYLHSCSSVWNLDSSITQLICVFVYLFSQKVKLKLYGLLAHMMLRQLFCKAAGTIARGSAFKRDHLAAHYYDLSPAICPKPLLHNAHLTSYVQNRFAKLTYVF